MQKNPNHLFITVLISGACAMVVEIAGARVISPYLGSTIYTWAAVIGMVLASLSMGYYIGGMIADKYNDKRHFSQILLAASVLTLAIPFLGKLFVPFTVMLDISLASLMASSILVPASIFYGMVSPYAIKLTAQGGKEGKGAGSIFALSTLGSISGALATGFILIPNLGLTAIFIFAAALMLLSGWLMNDKKAGLELAIFTMLALPALQLTFNPPVSGTVVYQEDTPYYHLSIIDTVWGAAPARLLYLDNAASSGETRNGEPVFDYVINSRISYSLADDVGNALVMGVAGGTEIEELKRFFPDARIDGVDIDRRTIEAGKKYFSLKEDNRTKIIIDDGRRYIRTTATSYDLIVIDAFRTLSIPYHITTLEFLDELKQRLKKDGVVIVNIISSLEGERAGLFIYMYNTFKASFERVIVMPVGDDREAIQNILLIATDRNTHEFERRYSAKIYHEEVPQAQPLTDELNPIEVYVPR